MTNEHLAAERRHFFAIAVAAYRDDLNNPDLSVMINGRVIPVVEICDLMIADDATMPDELAIALSLIPPAKYSKGAEYLKQYIVLKMDSGWVLPDS